MIIARPDLDYMERFWNLPGPRDEQVHALIVYARSLEARVAELEQAMREEYGNG